MPACKRSVFGTALLATLFVAGCSVKAPLYQASISNVETLRKAALRPLGVGTFGAQEGAVGATSIGLRANTMESPIGASFADYLAEALRQELELARLLDPKSSVQVSGVMIRNDIAAAGVATNSGEIEALFVVNRDGQTRYEKQKRAFLEWESSFVGNVAIPKAQQQYPLLVQRLLGELFSDTSFIEACR